MRIFLLIFAALAVAGGTGYYVLLQLQPKPVAPVAVAEAPRGLEVYVPARQLNPGAIIVPEHLRRISLASASLTPEMVMADAEGEALLLGSVVRQVLNAGVPIARSATVRPGERGFLAAVLPKGKRAISMPITEVGGLSGLVLPGDRVDIILTYSVSGADIASERDVRASETVMLNLRVLALDQRLHGAEQDSGSGTNAVPPIARTATLEVTPQQAEMITLATTLGDLSLVLNSVRDGGEEETALEGGPVSVPLDPRQATLDSDVTSLLRRRLGALRAEAEEAPAPIAEISGVPLRDRILRIQVVRGTSAGAIEIGPSRGSAAAEPAAMAAPLVQ